MSDKKTAKPFAVHFAKPVFITFEKMPDRPMSLTRFRSDEESMRGAKWEVTSVGIVINGTTIPFGNITCFGESL